MAESVDMVDNNRAEASKLSGVVLMMGRENVREHCLPSASCIEGRVS